MVEKARERESDATRKQRLLIAYIREDSILIALVS